MFPNRLIRGLVFLGAVFVVWYGLYAYLHEGGESNQRRQVNQDAGNDSENRSNLSPFIRRNAQTEVRAASAVDDEASRDKSTNTEPEIKSKKPFGVFTEEEMDALGLWQEERGYLNSGKNVDNYAYYDMETLRVLAENGDPKAQLLYGRHAWMNDRNFEAAKEAFINATVQGYTSSLNELGGMHLNLFEQAQREEKPEAAREYLITAYAWWETGMLRGDKTLYWTQNAYSPKKPFSEREQDVIKQRAQEIYSYLSTKRNESGFSEFDNHTPVVLDEVFTHLMQDQ